MRRAQLMTQLEQIGPSGHALAVSLLGNADDAADVLQDAVATALNARSYDPSRGTFRAWFLAVVRNRCTDVLRNRRRQPDAGVDLTEAPTEEKDSPEAVASHDELSAIVKRELATLPPAQREILELSYAEIGNVLGVPAGTVMSRLHRARSNLADRVKPYG